MGRLHYDASAVEIDDRVLAHLQIVTVQKFRRGESFLMSWLQGDPTRGSRGSLWMTPHTPVYFRFLGSRVPAIDEAWLGRLAESAGSSTGLILTDESGRPIWLEAVRPSRRAHVPS